MSDLVIAVRALTRAYEMGAEVVHALRGVDLGACWNFSPPSRGPITACAIKAAGTPPLRVSETTIAPPHSGNS